MGLMSKDTPATRVLDAAGIAYTLHRYDYDPGADRIGIQAAEALGEPADRVFKTLMVLVDGQPVCVALPSDKEVAMKKLAKAAGGRKAEMMKPADAERVTGYRVGGISPFGQKRRAPIIFDQSAMIHELIYVNGGQRGLQIRLDPRQAKISLDAALADIAI